MNRQGGGAQIDLLRQDIMAEERIQTNVKFEKPDPAINSE